MDGWQAVIKILKEENVEIVFGLPTTHLMTPHLEEAGVKPIQVRHEASAVFMAMAYSRLKGLPSVVYASPGPGVANIVPAMLEAYSSCLPVIATCPSTSTKTEGMGAVPFVNFPKGEVLTTIKISMLKKRIALRSGRIVNTVAEDDRACRVKVIVEDNAEKILEKFDWDTFGLHRVSFVGDHRQEIGYAAKLLGLVLMEEDDK